LEHFLQGWYHRYLANKTVASNDGSRSGPVHLWLCAVCIFSLINFSPLQAQQGNNPFDQTKDEKISQNPFDLIHRGNNSAEGYNPFDVVKNDEQNMNRLEQMPRRRAIVKPKDTEQDNFNFILYSSILILFTFLFTIHRSHLLQIYRGFLNENILKLLHREQTGIVKAPILIWYFFSALSISAFVLHLARHFYPAFGENLWANFGWIFLGMLLIYILKHLGMIIIGSIYPIQKEMGIYSFTFIITNIILGLILVPANLIIAFGPSSTYAIFIYIGLTLAGITYSYGYLRILFMTSQKWLRYIFHFFIYLCTFEIAPIIVLFKLIMY